MTSHPIIYPNSNPNDKKSTTFLAQPLNIEKYVKLNFSTARRGMVGGFKKEREEKTIADHIVAVIDRSCLRIGQWTESSKISGGAYAV